MLRKSGIRYYPSTNISLQNNHTAKETIVIVRRYLWTACVSGENQATIEKVVTSSDQLCPPVPSSIPDRAPKMDENWTFGFYSSLYAKGGA
jgi:hypothetical protein